VHDSVGTSTLDMTPVFSILSNSVLTFGRSGRATLLRVVIANGLALSLERIGLYTRLVKILSLQIIQEIWLCNITNSVYQFKCLNSWKPNHCFVQVTDNKYFLFNNYFTISCNTTMLFWYGPLKDRLQGCNCTPFNFLKTDSGITVTSAPVSILNLTSTLLRDAVTDHVGLSAVLVPTAPRKSLALSNIGLLDSIVSTAFERHTDS